MTVKCSTCPTQARDTSVARRGRWCRITYSDDRHGVRWSCPTCVGEANMRAYIRVGRYAATKRSAN